MNPSVISRFLAAVLALSVGAAVAEDSCQYEGDLDLEISDCTTAIQSGGRSGDSLADAYANRAEAWLKSGQFGKALADSDEALRVRPNQIKALLIRGAALQGNREYERAIVDYDKAIELDPANIEAHTLRGGALGLAGELDEAIAESTRAIELAAKAPRPSYVNDGAAGINPIMARALYNRGLAWKLKGGYQQAIADYNQALRANPADPRSWRQADPDWDKKTAAEQAGGLYRDIGFSFDMNTSDSRIFAVGKVQKTRFGNALLVQTNSLPPATILFNGQQVFQALGMYAAIFGYFQIHDADVILLGTNPGGATPETELSFLVINSESQTHLVADPDFVTRDAGGLKTLTEANGRMFVNLGFRDGDERVAEFDVDKLALHVQARKATPLSAADCLWLYVSAAADCGHEAARQADCEAYAANAGLDGSVYEMRHFQSISKKPGFTQSGLNAYCMAWCEGETVAYPQFSQSTCNIH